MTEIEKILIEIQDFLVPRLDTYEQAVYHYIFRHTILNGNREMYFSTRTAEIGFGSGNNTSKPSMKTRSNKLRSLEEKGAIQILERSNKGILVHIYLPSEIQGLIKIEEEIKLDLDVLDFYKDRKLLPAILKRENYRCFYTGKIIDENSCYLDHVVPQSKGGDNGYRNVVASCYDANSMKSDKDIEQFIRELYKEGLLALEDFKALKEKIDKLKQGDLLPDIQLIKKIYS